jgi:hypothetical protein
VSQKERWFLCLSPKGLNKKGNKPWVIGIVIGRGEKTVRLGRKEVKMFDSILGETVSRIAGFGSAGGGIILSKDQMFLGVGQGNRYLKVCPAETYEFMNKYDLQGDAEMVVVI